MFKTRKVSNKTRTPNSDYSDGETALHVAAQQGKHELVEALLANGANVNARDNKGRTPLHLASANGARDVVDVLVAGAPILILWTTLVARLCIARSRAASSISLSGSLLRVRTSKSMRPEAIRCYVRRLLSTGWI